MWKGKWRASHKCAVGLDSVGESSFGANFEKRLAGPIYVGCKIIQHA